MPVTFSALTKAKCRRLAEILLDDSLEPLIAGMDEQDGELVMQLAEVLHALGEGATVRGGKGITPS